MAESSKRFNARVIISVAIVAVFQSAFTAFSSVLADMVKVFPNVSPTLLQMILTAPSMMSIPVSLLAGVLASYISKKSLCVMALVCELFGGCIPLLFHANVGVLIVSSAFIGVGQGFLIVISSAILAEYFDGYLKGWAMGFRQAASSVSTAGLTILTGFLCSLAWWKSYFIYLLVIPVLIFTVILLPKGKLDAKFIGKEAGHGRLKKILTPRVLYWCVLFFILGFLSFSFYLNVGMSITSKGLGNSSTIGLTTAWSSVVTIAVATGFGAILRGLKKYTMAVSILLYAAAYLMLFFAANLVTVILGGIVYGIASGIQLPGSTHFLTEAVSQEDSTIALAISNAFISLGITLSPVIINTFAGMIGPVNGTTGMLVAGAGCAVMVAVELIYEVFFGAEAKAL